MNALRGYGSGSSSGSDDDSDDDPGRVKVKPEELLHFKSAKDKKSVASTSGVQVSRSRSMTEKPGR
jgi:hypothetical protein